MRKKGKTLVSKLIKLAVLAVVVVVIVQAAPDLKRYIKLRDM
ncbi:MAG TPA: hypothetical protein VMV07_00210 [Streptosporangiaceae bacterium]|nr:hypothetical protein [Streptosporangiaceae bacterium]